MRGNLKDNQAKLDNYEKSIKAAQERRRKVIIESKLYTYDKLSQLYGGAEGQALLNAVTAEHTLIGKLTDSGMSYADIEDGKVATVITKDLSRLGRDYLKTGELIEMVFPDYDVRYIAVNDNVDTAKSENELLAFKNIFNDWYALLQGRDNGRHNAKIYRWGAQTIAHILERYEYCGHTVNFRTKMKSYKVHKIVYNPQEEWQIFENTQEPIITQQTFDLVQELRKHKRRPQRSEVVNPFAGMVYCADCGEKMYLSRRKNERPEQEHMRCSTYAKEQDKCTVHYIRTCVLNEIVLGELNKLLTMVRGNEEEFVKRVMSSSVQRKSSELTKAKKTLKQAEKRIAELDKLFTRLYEDNVLGRLSDERFTMMSAGYEEEHAKLKATVAELTAFVETAEQKSSDVTAFLKVVHKYEHIETLTPEIMHELIDKIIVHEPDKSSGKRVQDIEIHFRFDVTVSTISVETGKYEKKRSHNRRCYATTLRKKKLLYHYCAFVYAFKYSRTASKLSIFLYTIDNISSVGAIRSGTIIGIIFAL